MFLAQPIFLLQHVLGKVQSVSPFILAGKSKMQGPSLDCAFIETFVYSRSFLQYAGILKMLSLHGNDSLKAECVKASSLNQ